jgi:hypothetical protein
MTLHDRLLGSGINSTTLLSYLHYSPSVRHFTFICRPARRSFASLRR